MPISARKLRSSSVVAVLLLLVGACSSGQHTSSSTTGGRPTSSGTTTGSSLSALGQECSDAFPCGDGLTCFANIPDGYCSKTCNSDADCPPDGSCVAPIPGQQICVSSCSGFSVPCNRLAYSCDDACSVCVPTAAQGLVSCPGHVLGGGGRAPDGGFCGPSLAAGGFLSWSAPVEVSADALTASEAEGALVSSPSGLVTAFMVVPGDAGSPPPQNWIGRSASIDDGASFTSQAPIVSEPNAFAVDPTLAVDSSGNLFLAYAGYDPSNGGIPHLWVSLSSNGTSWSAPQDALGPGDTADGGGGVDKPVIAVNPATQQPVVVFADFTGLFGGLGPYAIKMMAAPAGSTSFSPSVSLDDGKRAAFRDLPSVAFDQAGVAYVAWIESLDSTSVIEDQAAGDQLTGSALNSIFFTTATVRDGGSIVPQPTNHLVSGDGGQPIVVDSAHVAVAPDGTATYVVYVIAAGSGGTDIQLAVSHDQGFTWPVRTVVDDQPGCATHFHPAPFLDAKGRLWISWVDNRDGAGNVYVAFSTNRGASFSASQLVSSAPFYFTTFINPSNGNGTVPAWLGGYQVLTGTSSELYALWTGAQGGTGPDSPAHLYFSKAPLP